MKRSKKRLIHFSCEQNKCLMLWSQYMVLMPTVTTASIQECQKQHQWKTTTQYTQARIWIIIRIKKKKKEGWESEEKGSYIWKSLLAFYAWVAYSWRQLTLFFHRCFLEVSFLAYSALGVIGIAEYWTINYSPCCGRQWHKTCECNPSNFGWLCSKKICFYFFFLHGGSSITCPV